MVLALGVASLVAGRRIDAGWAARMRPLQDAWAASAATLDASDAGRRASAPEGALPGVRRESRMRTIVARGSIVLFVVAFVVFMFSVWMRKPCRRCDERYWTDPVEQLIDVLSLWSGVTLLVIAAGALVAVALHVVGLVVREGELLAWARTGGVRQVPLAQLAEVLFGPSPARYVARGSGALAGAVATLAFGVSWSGWWNIDPISAFLAAVGLALLSLVLFVADAALPPYRRAALRAATAPGDLRAPAPASPRGRGDRGTAGAATRRRGKRLPPRGRNSRRPR